MNRIHRPVVATYRGIDLGWVPVAGKPRTQADTERLLVLVNKIRPDFSNKIRPAVVGR